MILDVTKTCHLYIAHGVRYSINFVICFESFIFQFKFM